MTKTLQVAYPVVDGTSFDYDYYFDTHMALVGEHMGSFIEDAFATRGASGGPGTPPPFYAIATLRFADEAALQGALAASGPVMADIPKFTDTQPQILIGEVG